MGFIPSELSCTGRKGKDALSNYISIYPSRRRHLVQHFPSHQSHCPPSPREPVGCDALALQVQWRRARGREAEEALAGESVPLLAGDKSEGVSLSQWAEGSRQPSLSGVGCHQHIKHPAELLSALTQRGSILPNRNRGGQGQGDFTSCTLLAHIMASVS